MMARAPGVGPKLAARLVLELKDKAPALAVADFGACGIGSEPRPSSPKAAEDAVLALVSLGYARPQAAAAVARISAARSGGGDRRADPRGPEGTRAMSGRPFFVPMIGIVLLFAGLGPAIGGALFIPLSVVFRTPTDLEAIGLVVLISTCSATPSG